MDFGRVFFQTSVLGNLVSHVTCYRISLNISRSHHAHVLSGWRELRPPQQLLSCPNLYKDD